MTAPDSGWVALAGHIVGTPQNWETVWTWDEKYHPTRDAAVRAGFGLTGSDDFDLGEVRNGILVWFGWMDKEHPPEDWAAVAGALGWAS
jgi:hypothetical protein